MKIYLDSDKEKLLEQLELINPDVIICGGTYKEYCRLNGVKPYTGMKKITDWTYTFNGKLVFDYIHPSAPRIYEVLSYYTISSMFQKSKCSIEI
ncbi:uracil-DNA glycosylase family protein [Clostridium beijerinckii]|uniref:uracil-DNA glycosylase family protein n=1 Tax=Clostridium beijerinckii TaxID=1520 RepID=UPI001F30E0F8|nr:uracil-DNA glycosylase family protein [Clostridium beijerinckii]